MGFSLLEKLASRLEGSKTSSFKGFFIGLLVAAAFWLVYRARKKLEHRRDYLSARAEALMAIQPSELAEDKYAKIAQEIRLNKNAAKVVAKKIDQVDSRIANIKRRIDSARSIDELEDL